MFRQVRFWLGCGVLFLVLGSSTAFAQNNGIGLFGGGAGGYGFGYFNYGSGLNSMNQSIPFYALYPPVYYSYPVARPYGYSPFAYPPGVATPEVPPAAAQYLNPHVPQKAEPKGVSERVAESRMYINPFVQRANAASSVSMADEATR